MSGIHSISQNPHFHHISFSIIGFSIGFPDRIYYYHNMCHYLNIKLHVLWFCEFLSIHPYRIFFTSLEKYSQYSKKGTWRWTGPSIHGDTNVLHPGFYFRLKLHKCSDELHQIFNYWFYSTVFIFDSDGEYWYDLHNYIMTSQNKKKTTEPKYVKCR